MPKVQVLHERDPDSACSLRFYIDGVRVDGAEIEVVDVDPGAGYTDSHWQESADLQTGDTQFDQDVREAYLANVDGKWNLSDG